jgi:peptide/nickel transport system substrate-binding protein
MNFGRVRRRRLARVVTALVVPTVLVALAACTAGHSSTTSSTGSAPKSATFVMGLAGVPPQMDYQPFNGYGTRALHSILNSYLFNYDIQSCTKDAPTTTKLKGQLAKSWKVSADLKTADIKLKPITSQYGNTLSSADVLWSIQRGFAISGSGGRTMSLIAGLDQSNPVTIVSDSEFKLNFVRPTQDSLAAFTVIGTDIVDSVEAKKHATDADPWATAWMQTVSDGFGPYNISTIVPNDSITLTANPGWVGDMGNVKKVVIKQIADPSAAAQLLSAGSINFTNNVSWSQYRSFASSTKVSTYACAPTGRDEIMLQEKYAPLADVKVRQAISYALDRDAIVKGAYSGYAVPAETGFIQSALPSGGKYLKATYDLAKAKKLMAESSYPDGFELTLNSSTAEPGPQATQIAILTQSQLAKIGIKVTINNMASADALVTASHAQQYQAQILDELPPMPSVLYDAFLLQPIAPAGTESFDNKDYAAAFADLQNATTKDDFNAAVEKLTNYNITLAPSAFLVEHQNMMAMTKNVTGIDKAMGLAGAQLVMPNELTITK